MTDQRAEELFAKIVLGDPGQSRFEPLKWCWRPMQQIPRLTRASDDIVDV